MAQHKVGLVLRHDVLIAGRYLALPYLTLDIWVLSGDRQGCEGRGHEIWLRGRYLIVC